MDYTAQVPVTCVPPASVGLARNRYGRWGRPPDPDKPNWWREHARNAPARPPGGPQKPVQPSPLSQYTPGDPHA